MTLEEFKALQPGDIVSAPANGLYFKVLGHSGGRLRTMLKVSFTEEEFNKLVFVEHGKPIEGWE